LAAAPTQAPTRADFRALYDAHFAFVWRALQHFGLSPAQAEDAAQEVFVTLHRRLDEYDPTTPMRAWLWGMSRHVAMAERRKHARAERRQEVARPPSPSLPPDTALEHRQAVDFVQGFLESLPDELRDVFVMMELEGMSASEVASALDAKPNTVYSRLRLARGYFEQAGARLRAREARAG
jgi:RNA polymerase sigma-70 factor (ECF subfamily)